VQNKFYILGEGTGNTSTLRHAQGIASSVHRRELLTGNSFNYLDILNFSYPTRKNATVLRLHLPKPCTCLFLKSAKPLLINGY